MSNFSQVTSYLASFHGNTVPLEDLCISITDCPHSTPKWTDNGLIVLRSNNIKGGTLDLSAPSYTDPFSFQERIKRAAPEAGDIVITREAPMGEVCLIPDGLKCCLGQRMVLLKVDSTKISSQYLLFALQSEFVQKQIRKSDRTGSTVSNLCIPDLKALEIPILLNTDGIAAILKSITGKIELNNRINSELEAMARTLYEYWFVQFDFPDADGKPYKTSGGKMVYNSTLKREIPERWSDIAPGEIIERSGTGLNPRDNFKLGSGNNYYVTIKNVTNGKIVLDDKCDKIDDEALKIINRRSQLQTGDVLFTSIEPVGVTFLIQEQPSNWNINESVFTLRPNLEMANPEYLYMLLSSREIKTFTKNSSSGSVHKGIRHGVLKSFRFAHGGKKIVDNFSHIMKPILNRIHTLDKENSELAKLHVWLLPMLMNGQVTVK